MSTTSAPASTSTSTSNQNQNQNTNSTASSSNNSNSGSVILASGGFDHSIRLWEAPTGVCLRAVPFADSPINALAISIDKQLLLASGNPHLRLYNLNYAQPSSSSSSSANNSSSSSSSSAQLASFEGHTAAVTSCGFQKSNRWLFSSSEDSTVKVWDTRISTSAQRSYKHSAPVANCQLHPNQGELISCDAEGLIRVWDLTNNQCSREMRCDVLQPLTHLCISSDATTLVAASYKGQVMTWKLTGPFNSNVSSASPTSASSPPPSSSSSASSAHTPNNNAATTHASTPTSASSAAGNSPSATATPSASSSSSSSSLPSLPTHTFDAHNTYCLKALLSPDCKWLATTSADASIKIWNWDRDSNIFSPSRTLLGHTQWVWDVAWSADSAYLVTCSSDKIAKLWDREAGECILEYKGHQKAVTAIALNDAS